MLVHRQLLFFLLSSTAASFACSGDQFTSVDATQSGGATSGTPSGGGGSAGGDMVAGGSGGEDVTTGGAGGSGGTVVPPTGGITSTGGNAGAGGSSTGGATTGGTSTGGTGGSVARPGCGSVPPEDTALFHTTLDTIADIAALERGSSQGFMVGGTPGVVPAPSGNGIELDAQGEWIAYLQAPQGVTNIDPREGSIDFCFNPTFPSVVTMGDATDLNYVLFRVETDDGFLQVRKANSANDFNLQVTAVSAAGTSETNFSPNDFAFVPGIWKRLTVTWRYNTQLDGERQVRLFVDGREISPVDPSGTGPFAMLPPSSDRRFYIGGDGIVPGAMGSFDEFVVHSVPITP